MLGYEIMLRVIELQKTNNTRNVHNDKLQCYTNFTINLSTFITPHTIQQLTFNFYIIW